MAGEVGLGAHAGELPEAARGDVAEEEAGGGPGGGEGEDDLLGGVGEEEGAGGAGDAVAHVEEELDGGEHEEVRGGPEEGEEVGPVAPGAAPSCGDVWGAGPELLGARDEGAEVVVVLDGEG